MHYVYMLKCKDDTYYTGYTNNLEKRIQVHNEGKGAKYTRGRGPVELVYFEEYGDKQTAMRREWEIKQLTRSEKEILIQEWKGKRQIDDKKRNQRRTQNESK